MHRDIDPHAPSGKCTSPIFGKWLAAQSDNGNRGGARFYKDSTYEAFVNEVPFVTGTFSIRDSILTMSDYGCANKVGTYKLIRFGNCDSMRFELIDDECEGRRNGMTTTILGRVSE